MLGRKYRHVPYLGARSFRRGTIDAIQNLQLGVQTLLNLDSNIILMFACAEYDGYHRRLIAAELERQKINVVEFLLSPPRLISYVINSETSYSAVLNARSFSKIN